VKRLVVAVGLAVLLVALVLPARAPEAEGAPPGAAAFAWSRDAYWASLEARFAALLTDDCAVIEPAARREQGELEALLARLGREQVDPGSVLLDSLERRFFEIAPAAAACPALAAGYARLQASLRETVKDLSRGWSMRDPATRARLYGALYGARAAVEEVILHHPAEAPAMAVGRPEPSETPGVTVQGVEIHSGDMLVSRGGYPTSALIARGNDYPGNFSHVALVHVDSLTGQASTIEAHIERGVSVSTAEEYLRDKKLRIMVLRLRRDVPALRADPLLPHRAATRALERARSEHVPYDFTMDYTDASRLFCSEVASSVYRDLGVTLWTGLSTISAPGLRRWLASFGVRHFETQEPSDLEYDPNLVVVAEWRDPASLAADHLDNAVVDAMLEGAERGDDLTFAWYRLPLARLAKAYSWVMLRMGRTGPIPEGMSAAAALRNQEFSARQRRLAARVTARAEEHIRSRGYPPPYWTLLQFAREAQSSVLSPQGEVRTED
jgi:hypothetical protein